MVLSISYAYAQSSGPAPRHKPFPLKSYEVLKIQKLVSVPELYNLHFIRLQGTVDVIQKVPYGTLCGQGVAYVMTLKDETGEIKIIDKGRCGQNFGNRGPILTSDLASGDTVDVLVIVSYIQQPGKEIGELETILNWVERSQ
jgi:hypothetical protein